MLYGAKEHAGAKEIKGKKSNGIEDYSSYNNWAVKKDKVKGGNWSGDFAGAILTAPFKMAKKIARMNKPLDIN